MFSTRAALGALSGNSSPKAPREVVAQAWARLADCPQFARRLDCLSLELDQDRLILSGRVPTFYLKSLLQSAIGGLPPGVRLVNRVDVVNCEGLSSTHRVDPAHLIERTPTRKEVQS